uniref:Uncharacterized protein n=1 Tax=Anguilla anguilla TaxID=7936 RepID=A0A0E9VIW3_ANGAN
MLYSMACTSMAFVSFSSFLPIENVAETPLSWSGAI